MEKKERQKKKPPRLQNGCQMVKKIKVGTCMFLTEQQSFPVSEDI